MDAVIAHSHTAQGRKTPEYAAWHNAKMRVSNPRATGYANYGGRGITMCAEWMDSFEVFLRDMGSKPSPSHSIDRIDNDGPYAPWNCRWATSAQQHSNKRWRNQVGCGFVGRPAA